MTQALYRKWRPQDWDAVIGQQHVVQTLRNALAAGRVAHAYLFAGPRGTGKTTTARLLAKAVNCLDEELPIRPCGQCAHCQALQQGRFLDLIEIDAASNTSVDDVRELRDKINFSPNQGRYKVYIVDEVHMLSTAAFNALLKTLEEPPPHAIFILATTEAHKIPATVLSRCQRHEFRRIPVGEIVAFLEKLSAEEGIQAEKDALNLVARQATGSMRDAISLLDQLASSAGPVTLEMAQIVLGTATSQAVLDLVEALIGGRPAQGLEAIHQTLDSGSDPRQFARQVTDYLRGLLLVQMQEAGQIEATPELRQQMARHARAFDTSQMLRLIRAFNQAAVEGRGLWQPALPLEMAFVEGLQITSGRSAEPQSAAGAPGEPVRKAAAPAAKTSQEQPIKPAGEVAQPSPTAPPDASKPVAKPSPTTPPDASKLAAKPPPAAPDTSKPTTKPPPATPPAQVQAPAGGAPPSLAGAVAAATPASAGEPSPLDLQATQSLSQVWPQVAQVVRQISPNTIGLLNSCKARYIQGGQLVLCFGSPVLKKKMERPEELDALQQALRKVLGREMPVRCIFDTAKRDAVPPEVDTDGMVAAALRDLGGEIVDVQ